MEKFCRFCFDMFCCAKCRLKHEKLQHNLETDCGICVEGQMRYSAAVPIPQSIVTHITIHFPVYCKNCKIVFNNVDSLAQHSKCSYSDLIATQSKSIIISSNMETNFTNSSDRTPLSIMVTTSTPMGTDSTINMRNYPLLEISPPDGQLTDTEDSNQLSTNPNSLSKLKLITPLHSIIKLNKSSSRLSSNQRRVTFSDVEHQQSEVAIKNSTETERYLYWSPPYRMEPIKQYSPIPTIQTSQFQENDSEQLVMKNSEETEGCAYWSPQYKTKRLKHYFPSTPRTATLNKSETFYTPEGQSIRSDVDENLSPMPTIPKPDALFVPPHNWKFESIWTTVAKAFKSMFMHVKTPAIAVNTTDSVVPLSYTHTSGSVKRFLSPSADKTLRNMKRMCIRGRKSVKRLHSSIE